MEKKGEVLWTITAVYLLQEIRETRLKLVIRIIIGEVIKFLQEIVE
jgi:hypothetical protein